MSWADLAPPKPSGGRVAAAEASLSMMDGKGRWTAGHILIVRPNVMEEAPDWLVAGRTVSVAIGAGEHAGSVRITPGGPFILAKGVGKAKEGTVKLRLAPLPGVAIATHPATPCECEWTDAWVEVALPAWTKPAPPAPPKPPFVSLSERVKDPAAERRADAAGRRK